MALALEGRPRQAQRTADTVRIERAPVDLCALQEERCDRIEHGDPIVDAAPQSRQDTRAAIFEDGGRKGRQGRMRPKLEADIDFHLRKLAEPICEAHGVARMPAPISRRCKKLSFDTTAGDIRNDVRARRLEYRLRGLCLQSIKNRLDQRRMESMRHRERMALHAFGCERMADRCDCRRGAGNDGLGRAVDGRDRRFPCIWRDCPRHQRLGREHCGHGPAGGKRLHQGTAGRDETQRVRQVERASDAGGDIFADRMPQHGDGRHAERAQERRQRIFHREQGRLGKRRLLERLCVLGFDDQFAQRAAEQRRQDLVAAIEGLAERWRGSVEAGGHAGVLCALAGEQERDAGRIAPRERGRREAGRPVVPRKRVESSPQIRDRLGLGRLRGVRGARGRPSSVRATSLTAMASDERVAVRCGKVAQALGPVRRQRREESAAVAARGA